MAELDDLLDRLEALLTEVEAFDELARQQVLELLDGIDALHRMALSRLGAELGERQVATLRDRHPAIAWLFDAYGVGVDQRAAAQAALDPVRGYIESHGGDVQILDVRDGVVSLRMSGACSGCTASAVTLREGIEEALRDGFPGFVAVEALADDATPHPPPGPTLLQIGPRPDTV